MKQSVFSMTSLTLRLLYQISVAALLIGTPAVAWGQPRESPIHEAAYRGDVARIRQLLEDDSLLVNSPGGSRGTTPLHSAIKGGQLEAAKVLLDHGADIEADVFSEGRPLQLAVEMRDRAMVRLLLERGANANGKGRTQEAPPIVKARNDPEMVKLLIEHGASVDGSDRFGGTPLIYAAASGNLRMVKMLLDEGASIHVQGSLRVGTPLDGAIRGGHLAVAQLLLQEGAWPGKTMGFPLLTDQQLKDPQLVTERLQLAVRAHRHFWAACGNGQVEKVQSFLRMFPYLAQVEDQDYKSALTHALAGGHSQIIKLLIDHGADPNESDGSEGTPLVQATKLGNLKVIETLVENGANVNFKGIGGRPVAIHTAVESGNTEVVKFLLDHVNVEALGRSVLSTAAGRGNVEMAKLLVEHGADPKLGASAYYEPLYWAVQSGSADMVGYLLDQGPSLEDRRHAMHEAARVGRENIVRLIAESGVEMDAYTWLHLANTEQLEAALRKDPELLRATYGEGSSEGRTLLHIAVSLGCVEAAKVLTEHGADPNARGRMWNTPLHAAALNGNLACVKLLVEHGASVNVRNRQGMTALDVVDPDMNRHLALRMGSDVEEIRFESIRRFLAGKGAESGLNVPEGETRAGEIVKRPPLTGPSFRIGQWALYPGAEYRLQSADSTILIRNADGKAYVEVLFQHGEKKTKIVRDPSKKEPFILTRIEGDKEESVSFKATNDFRAREPELLKRFQQFEKDIYEGEVEGSWELSGPSEAQGPLVIPGN